MLIKTDENLHPDVAALLREGGHDALTVSEQQLQGSTDAVIIEVCRREDRALITLDVGFADIRNYPPEQYRGLIVLRLNSQSRAHVVAVVTRLLPLLDTQPLAGALWIVSESGVRIHVSDA